MRAAFDQELTELQARLVELGVMVQTQLAHALAALATGDPGAIQGIVRGDQQINQLSAEIDWGLLRTLACQAPVGSDLRLVAGLLHVNEHLERMGDLCVNLARAIPGLVERSPPAHVQATLTRMGVAVSKVVNAALACFAHSDSAGAEWLPALDAAVDQLNDGIFRQLNQITDPTAVAWATRLVLVARFLERLGDQAVDVGEQVCFIVTGEVRELQPPRQPGPQPAPDNRQLTAQPPVGDTLRRELRQDLQPVAFRYKTAANRPRRPAAYFPTVQITGGSSSHCAPVEPRMPVECPASDCCRLPWWEDGVHGRWWVTHMRGDRR